MQEALRVAHEADKAEEEEFMRKALEESKKLEDASKIDDDEEMKMIQEAIEMSKKDEEVRKEKEE